MANLFTSNEMKNKNVIAEHRIVWKEADVSGWFREARNNENKLDNNENQQSWTEAKTNKLSLPEIIKKLDKKDQKAKAQESHRKEASMRIEEEKAAQESLRQVENLRFKEFQQLLANLGLEYEIDNNKQIIGIYPIGAKNGWGPNQGNHLNNFRFKDNTVSFKERDLDEKIVCNMELKKTDTGYKYFLNGEEQEDVDTKINEKNQGGIEKEKLLDAPKEAQELAQRGYGYELNKSKKIVAIYP
jgi:hypothetical protein